METIDLDWRYRVAGQHRVPHEWHESVRPLIERFFCPSDENHGELLRFYARRRIGAGSGCSRSETADVRTSLQKYPGAEGHSCRRIHGNDGLVLGRSERVLR